MNYIRPIKENDFDQFLKLVSKAQVGLSSLPLDEEYLMKRIKNSQSVFQDQEADGDYLFVLEDPKVGIVGCCGIAPRTGGELPFYTFALYDEIHSSTKLIPKTHHPYVKLHKVFQGPTEIGSLFLDPDYRKKGMGRLLSYSRFLFMGCFPTCFRTEVIAEIRGVISKEGESPFFQAIGQHFFQMDFPYIDYITSLDKSLLEDLLPKQSIYLNLLSDEVRACIQKPHALTQGAFDLLIKQGFHKKKWLDVFDGGPVVSANLFEIKAVREAKMHSISAQPLPIKDSYFISNISKDFRAIYDEVSVEQDQVYLSPKQKEILGVHEGQYLRLWKGD